MVTSVQGANPAYFIAPVSYGDNAFSNVSNNAANSNAINANSYTNFEQLVALQNQEFALNSETTADTTDTSLLDNATLVTLSPQALNILNGINTASEATAVQSGTNNTENVLAPYNNTSTNTTNTLDNANNSANASTDTPSVTATDTTLLADSSALTSAQLEQIAGVVSQFANEPLTPATVSQIQSTLVSEGFNPQQISLQDILVSMNYIGLSPVSTFDNQAINDATLTDELIAA